jgi:hypothetical protein
LLNTTQLLGARDRQVFANRTRLDEATELLRPADG